MSGSAPIPLLNDDLLITIIRHLDHQDVLLLRSVSKHFADLSRLHLIWTGLLQKHVIEAGLPYPVSEKLDDNDKLEVVVRTAMWLNRVFSSNSKRIGEPVRRYSSTQCTGLVATLQMLGDGSFLVLHYQPGGSSLSRIGFADRILMKQTLARNITNMAFEGEKKEDVRMLIKTICENNTATLSIINEFAETNASYDFALHVKPVGCYCNLIAFYDDRTAELSVVDLEHARPNLTYGPCLVLKARSLEDDQFIQMNSDNKLVSISFHDASSEGSSLGMTHAIVCRFRTIDHYIIPSESGAGSIAPVATYTWPWGSVHSFSSSLDLRRPSRDHKGCLCINVLVRFSVYYPWPAGLINHYRITLRGTSPMVVQKLSSIPCTSDAFDNRALTVGYFGRAVWADMAPRGGAIMTAVLHRDLGGDGEEKPLDIKMLTTLGDASLSSVCLEEVNGTVALGFDDGEVVVLQYL